MQAGQLPPVMAIGLASASTGHMGASPAGASSWQSKYSSKVSVSPGTSELLRLTVSSAGAGTVPSVAVSLLWFASDMA